jgi:hypothetical protein
MCCGLVHLGTAHMWLSRVGVLWVRKKRNKMGTKAKFGGSVASMIWGEQQAVETTTRFNMSVRNCLVHA